MMPVVFTLEEAMEWFLENRAQSVICSDGLRQKECTTYPEAEEFYNEQPEEVIDDLPF